MRYMILIYGAEAVQAALTQAELETQMNAYNQFTQDITQRGAMLHGEALHPTTAATTVRLREGKVVTTDGPFAETKEQLGGFYVIKCNNLDEAIEIAAKIPGAQTGAIEIRPVVEWD